MRRGTATIRTFRDKDGEPSGTALIPLSMTISEIDHVFHEKTESLNAEVYVNKVKIVSLKNSPVPEQPTTNLFCIDFRIDLPQELLRLFCIYPTEKVANFLNSVLMKQTQKIGHVFEVRCTTKPTWIDDGLITKLGEIIQIEYYVDDRSGYIIVRDNLQRNCSVAKLEQRYLTLRSLILVSINNDIVDFKW